MRSLLPALVLAAVLVPSPAAACSCGPSGTPQERFDKADGVVFGTVVSNNIVTLLPSLIAGQFLPRELSLGFRGGAKAHVRVRDAYKTDLPRVITVNLGTGMCCDCSLGLGGLSVGDDVVLFGRQYKGKLRIGASSCNEPLRGVRARDFADQQGPGDGRVGLLPSVGFLFQAGVWLLLLGAFGFLVRLAFRRRGPRP